MEDNLFEKELSLINNDGNLRKLIDIDNLFNDELLNLSSNDYLAISSDNRLREIFLANNDIKNL